MPQNVLESIQKLHPSSQTNTTTNSMTNTDNQNLDTTPVNNENKQESVQTEQAVSANGVKFEIVKGIKDCEDKNKGGSHYQEILKAIYPDNNEKILFSTNKDNTLYDSDCYLMGGISGLEPSPDGRYLEFNVGGFEWYTVYMLNVDTGKYVFSPGDGNNIAYVSEIKWSADSNNFAIITQMDEFAGEGENGVYVSEYNNPDKIKKIWGDKNSPGNIKNVNFVGNDKLNIDIELEQSKHGYDFQQGKLTF
jgi:hypothetical protein